MDESSLAYLGVPAVVADAARVAQRLGPVGAVAPQRRRLRVAVRAPLAGDARQQARLERLLHLCDCWGKSQVSIDKRERGAPLPIAKNDAYGKEPRGRRGFGLRRATPGRRGLFER